MAVAARMYGKWIPPRKEPGGRSRHFTLKFLLIGSIPAKKNNQVAIPNTFEADRFADQCFQEKGHMTKSDLVKYRKLLKARIVANSTHATWEKKAIEAISEQMKEQYPHLEKRGLIYPLFNCSAKVYHHWKDESERDLGNRLESIADMFVKAGLIANDHDKIINPIELKSGRYKGEMNYHATVINLTAYW